MRTGTRRREWIAVLALAYASIYLTYVRQYFYLFDDFALLQDASAASWPDIFSRPLFGFFRPVLFVLTKTVYAFSGWDHPEAYAALSSLVHFTNGLLAMVLARLCGLSTMGSGFAGILFLLAPTASESTFWLSGTFDSLALLGVLIATISGLRLTESSSAGAAGAWMCLGLAGAAAGLLSKEAAVTVPAMPALAWLIRGDGISALFSRRRLGYIAALAVMLGALLYVRSLVLPVLSGAYGSVEELWARTSVIGSYRQYWYAAARPPFPTNLALRSVTLYPFLVVVVPAAGLWLLWRRRRFTLWTALAFSVAVLPMIWMIPSIEVTNERRLLYVPGVWSVLLFSAALSAWCEDARTPRVRVLAYAAVALTFATATASTLHQRALWLTATRISRSVVGQLEPVSRSTDPVRIVNYPTRCAEGPWIHQGYALRYYYGSLPSVNIDANIVTCDDPIGRVVGTAPESVRQHAEVASTRVFVVRLP